MGRAPCCDKGSVKKGPWSPEEDRKLKEYIHKHGTGGNWIALPAKAGLKRCGKSCRLRWLNYLRPNIKHGDFSGEEDMIICSLFAAIGSRWSVIAAQLPGRTDNDIKNYWNTKLKKKLIMPPHMVDHMRLPAAHGHGADTDHHHHSHNHHQQQQPFFLSAASPASDPVLPPPLELPQYMSSSGALLMFGGGDHHHHHPMMPSCSDNSGGGLCNNVNEGSSVGLESFIIQHQLMQQEDTTTTTLELQAKKLLFPAADSHSVNGGGTQGLLLDQLQYESSRSSSNNAAVYSCYDQPAPEMKPSPMVAPPSTGSFFYDHASHGRFLY